MTKRTDNYKATQQAMAARILSSSLASTLSRRRLERLQDIVAGNGDSTFWSFLSAEFCRAGTEVSLGAKASSVETFSRRNELDDEGNEWIEYNITTDVNYSTHGSTDPATAMARAKLIGDVAMLAAELLAEFSRKPVWRMIRTAEQIKEDEAKRVQRELDSRVRHIVDMCRKGMKPEQSRTVDPSKVEGIPAGSYQVNFGDKHEERRYFLTVPEIVGTDGLLTRTA